MVTPHGHAWGCPWARWCMAIADLELLSLELEVGEERFFSSCLALPEKFGSGERGRREAVDQWWCGDVLCCVV